MVQTVCWPTTNCKEKSSVNKNIILPSLVHCKMIGETGDEANYTTSVAVASYGVNYLYIIIVNF